MKNLRKIFFAFLVIASFASCERDIDIDLDDSVQKLVVQGHIEPDSFAYVSISTSFPFFERLDLSKLLSSLVSGATVIVSDGVVNDTLQADLYLANYNIFNYRGTKIKGSPGSHYSIKILYNEHEIEGTTTIPLLSGLDSIYFRPKTGTIVNTRDSNLVELLFRYTDPDTPGNYARAFTKTQFEDFWGSDFFSVFNDGLINGGSVEFVLRGAKEPYIFTDSTTFEDFGYFKRGDSVQVKFANIDFAHYEFWRTLETAASSAGNPFASPAVVSSNLKAIKGPGVIGVFGGYGSNIYSLYIPKFQ